MGRLRTWGVVQRRRFSTSAQNLYHSRERRKSLYDPKYGLQQSHSYKVADSGFAVGAAFPNRARTITFAVTIRRSSAAAHGVIFEAGDATTGLAIWIPAGGSDISASVGDAGAGGATVTAANVLPVDGAEARVVVSVIPSTGELRLWVDGKLLGAATASTAPLPNGWAADSPAGVEAIAGTVTARVPIADRVALTAAAIITPVTAYDGQRPRQFGAGVSVAVVPTANLIAESGDNLIAEDGVNLISE